jgi:acyl carrier protein
LNAGIEEAIRGQLVSEYMDDRPDLELADETDLIEEGVLDSLGIFMLISFMEERFGLEIAADEVTLANFRHIGAIADFIKAKQAIGSST